MTAPTRRTIRAMSTADAGAMLAERIQQRQQREQEKRHHARQQAQSVQQAPRSTGTATPAQATHKAPTGLGATVAVVIHHDDGGPYITTLAVRGPLAGTLIRVPRADLERIGKPPVITSRTDPRQGGMF